MTGTFFDEQGEQSQIKAEIVSKYFFVWAKVIIAAQKRYNREKRVAYIDLFAGPLSGWRNFHARDDLAAGVDGT